MTRWTSRGVTLRELFFIVLAVLIGAVFVVPRIIHTVVSDHVQRCAANEMQIAGSLRAYAVDNDGCYPTTLGPLVPRYLKILPSCPVAHKDTYSTLYWSSRDHHAFNFFCTGFNHDIAHLKTNHPRCKSTGRGVIILPLDYDR